MKKYINSAVSNFGDEHWSSAYDAAQDPNTPEEVLADLAEHRDIRVRLAVKHNPSVSVDILKLPSIAEIDEDTFLLCVDCYYEGTEYEIYKDDSIIINLVSRVINNLGGICRDVEILPDTYDYEEEIGESTFITIGINFTLPIDIWTADYEEEIERGIVKVLDDNGFDISTVEYV